MGFIFGYNFLNGYSFAIRKSIYDKSGGFNSELNGQEDVDLSVRVGKIGKTKFVDEPVVVFSGRRFKKGLVLGLLSYSKSVAKYLLCKDKKNVILSDIR